MSEAQTETRKDRACKFAAANDLHIVPYCVARRTTYSAKTLAGEVIATASGYDPLLHRMQKYVETKQAQLCNPVSKEDAQRERAELETAMTETPAFENTGAFDSRKYGKPERVTVFSRGVAASYRGDANWYRSHPWILSGATWESRHASRTDAVRTLRRMVADLARKGCKLDFKHIAIERSATLA